MFRDPEMKMFKRFLPFIKAFLQAFECFETYISCIFRQFSEHELPTDLECFVLVCSDGVWDVSSAAGVSKTRALASKSNAFGLSETPRAVSRHNGKLILKRHVASNSPFPARYEVMPTLQAVNLIGKYPPAEAGRLR